MRNLRLGSCLRMIGACPSLFAARCRGSGSSWRRTRRSARWTTWQRPPQQGAQPAGRGARGARGAAQPAAPSKPTPHWPDGRVNLSQAPGHQGLLERYGRQSHRYRWLRFADESLSCGSSFSGLGQRTICVPADPRGSRRSSRAMPTRGRHAVLHRSQWHGVHRSAGTPADLHYRWGKSRLAQNCDGTWPQASARGLAESRVISAIRSDIGRGKHLSLIPVGFNEKFWFIRGGLPHTRYMHLIERFTRTGFRHIEIRSDDRR